MAGRCGHLRSWSTSSCATFRLNWIESALERELCVKLHDKRLETAVTARVFGMFNDLAVAAIAFSCTEKHRRHQRLRHGARSEEPCQPMHDGRALAPGLPYVPASFSG